MVIALVLGGMLLLAQQAQDDLRERDRASEMQAVSKAVSVSMDQAAQFALAQAEALARQRELKPLLAAERRDELLERTRDTYDYLKRQAGVSVFGFHTADMRYLLRVHKLDAFNDDISRLRPMVLAANKTRQAQSGLEMGVSGIVGVRGVAVMQEGEHLIGTTEVGVVEMDMSAFPFDRQSLVIGFSLPRHARQEVVLQSTEVDRRLSGVEPQLSLAQWSPHGLRFAHDQATGWNARSYSRLSATLDLERDATRYLLRIFIPLVAILGVSVFVLWTPGLAPKDEGSLVFSSLLALAALSFTLESSFPGAISMNTTLAQMLSLGYLYLVAVLFVRSLLGRYSRDPASPHHAMAAQVSRQVRWLLPVCMALICLGAAVRALPVR